MRTAGTHVLKEYGDDVAMVSTSTLIDYSNKWIVDFGCSNHMIGDMRAFDVRSHMRGISRL